MMASRQSGKARYCCIAQMHQRQKKSLMTSRFRSIVATKVLVLLLSHTRLFSTFCMNVGRVSSRKQREWWANAARCSVLTEEAPSRSRRHLQCLPCIRTSRVEPRYARRQASLSFLLQGNRLGSHVGALCPGSPLDIVDSCR